MAASSSSRNSLTTRWHEVYTRAGTVRPLYGDLMTHLQELSPATRRSLRDQMTATLREMGMTFNLTQAPGSQAREWDCDLLPHVIAGAEWELIVAGFRQRLRAWEHFLEDVYDGRRILRAGVVPVHAVLASPSYHGVARGLPRPHGSFLHLCGLCLARDAAGDLVVKQHFFGRAEGISYMVQNRRALARVAPELFQGYPVQSVAEAAVLILEHFRGFSPNAQEEPRVVLLSPGTATAAPQLSFLARRMGVPLVQGGDLIVLDDRIYLKTVRGLDQIDVIYNCVANEMLDPLVFRRDSRIGVAGLVHCLRKGTVALINSVGSELADDTTLLPFSAQIIRYYLNEAPILPSAPTLWLGDLDQREMALENRAAWRIRRIGYQNRTADVNWHDPKLDAPFLAEVKKEPGRYVAQPRSAESSTVCFSGARPCECHQDHVVYAVRSGNGFDVLPGALTRLHGAQQEDAEPSEWNSKDTWVLADAASTWVPPRPPRRLAESAPVAPQVMSRTADSFYWMGRYLERAWHQAYLISVIGTLETEELNSAERKHYRPIWNRLLPPLEKSAGTRRRAIANWHDRYRLMTLPQPGSVFRTFERAITNAEAMRDSISPEAWAPLNELQTAFRKRLYQEKALEAPATRNTRRLAELTTRLIPQYFALSACTMLADDGWRFCEVGRMLERAVITANSTVSISGSLTGEHREVATAGTEIELSAFLRLLGTRDAYRRIYQTRAEPVYVLELLWQHPEAPRSVRLCLERCQELMCSSTRSNPEADSEATEAVELLLLRLRRVDWSTLVPRSPGVDELESGRVAPERPPVTTQSLAAVQGSLLGDLLHLHTKISDGFFSHQSRIGGVSQPLLKGF
jgi:uncharacterized circularly permuted ATP-grasp superfamily protein/uncharacterized alpha-E superfamily protein